MATNPFIAIYTGSESSALTEAIGAEEKIFKKNGPIIRPNDGFSGIIMIISGMAYLLSINDSGDKSILDYYIDFDAFGYSLRNSIGSNLYYAVAKKRTRALFIPKSKLLDAAAAFPNFATELIAYLLDSDITRARLHNDILSQRSIRGKLVSYFNSLSEDYGRKQFNLPFSLSDLADYLAVDRSAMMRELKKMNNENIIISNKLSITILEEK